MPPIKFRDYSDRPTSTLEHYLPPPVAATPRIKLGASGELLIASCALGVRSRVRNAHQKGSPLFPRPRAALGPRARPHIGGAHLTAPVCAKRPREASTVAATNCRVGCLYRPPPCALSRASRASIQGDEGTEFIDSNSTLLRCDRRQPEGSRRDVQPRRRYRHRSFRLWGVASSLLPPASQDLS